MELSQTLFTRRAIADDALPMRASREVAGDGGPEVGELVHHLKSVVADGDAGSAADVLTHDLGFLQADGETELTAGISKAVDETLKRFLGVGGEACIVRKKHFPDEHSSHLGLCSETCQVKEASVTPGVEEDAVFRVPEGVAQAQGEEDAEEGRSKDASLLHSILDWEGVRG